MMQEKTPESERHLIAVMRSRGEAEHVVTRLTRMGLDPAVTRIDDDADYSTALRAEMRQELDEAVIMPQASFVATKEGSRGFVSMMLVALVVCAVVALPLALIDFGAAYWSRYLIVFAVLAVLALAFGLVFGPSLGTKDGDDVAAATRGTVLRIADNAPWIRNVLVDSDPIRVDETTRHGEPVATLFTESQDIDAHPVAQIKDTAAHVRHQYNRPR
jgi:hypothetical protein